jgi:hypothetical protein
VEENSVPRNIVEYKGLTAMTSDWNTVACFVLPLREQKYRLFPSNFFGEQVLELSTMSNSGLVFCRRLPGGVWFDSNCRILGTVLYAKVQGRHPVHNLQSSGRGAWPDMCYL